MSSARSPTRCAATATTPRRRCARRGSSSRSRSAGTRPACPRWPPRSPRRCEERQRLLDSREREILENHLVGEVASTLQELIAAAERRVADTNRELAERPTSTGMQLRLRVDRRPGRARGPRRGARPPAAPDRRRLVGGGPRRGRRLPAEPDQDGPRAGRDRHLARASHARAATTASGTASSSSAGRAAPGTPPPARRRAASGCWRRACRCSPRRRRTTARPATRTPRGS